MTHLARSTNRGRLRAALPLGLVLAALAVGCGGGAKAALPPIFYPPPPDEPKLQFLASFTTDTDVTGGASSFQSFLLGEEQSVRLGKVYGIAIHKGQIFVCDVGGSYVWILDLAKKEVGALGLQAPGRLAGPTNIDIDRDGTRYVADPGHGRVIVYDANNQFLRALGDKDAWRPVDVKVRGDHLYVTDFKNAQIVVIDKASGQEVRRLSSKGSGPDELFQPTSLDLDADGNIYVSDTGNFRVLALDPDGKLRREIGSLGRRPGQFVRPRGLAVDRNKRLYVADAAFQNVQIFDEEGRLLLFFGGPGEDRGNLNLPTQIAIDYDNVGLFANKVAPGYRLEYLILVVSQYGANKVNVYGRIVPEQSP